MGLLVIALFGTPAGWIANYLLGDSLSVARIALAIFAGVIGGLIIAVPIGFGLTYATHLDFTMHAILGPILGPPFTVLAAWKWRPKKHDPNDMRIR